MTDIVDPLLQVRALQELARVLPPGGVIQSNLFWENEHGIAGVMLGSDGRCTVRLFGDEREVESLSEAGDVLRRIFADEIASVQAYASEAFVYSGLAPVTDPSAAFVSGLSGTRRPPDVDYVVIMTWSRGIHEEDE